MTHPEILQTLIRHFVAVHEGTRPEDVDPARSMAEYGVSSLETSEAIMRATRDLHLRVPLSELNVNMNLNDLADLLLLHHEAKETVVTDVASEITAERRRLTARLGATSKKPGYDEVTYDMFLGGTTPEHGEIRRFNEWLDDVLEHDRYAFENMHLGAQRPEVRLARDSGRTLDLVNLASYNYLGYSYEPAVIQAAKDALDVYGLGATGSPIASGTLQIHRELEAELVRFFGIEGLGVSLFSSGYAVNVGTISAFMPPGSYVVCDRSAHMSILEGAQLSQARLRYFDHNNIESLDAVLEPIADQGERILVCVEGVYSADGDFGRVKETVELARAYGAKTLVDEAHSMLLCGRNGRGVCDAQGVLGDVDLLVLTFSKGFGGVGGALVARREITRYVNWYARCRMFSCALDPAVTGGIRKALELAATPDGEARRKRLCDNAAYLRGLLRDKVDIGTSESWIVPVIFGPERRSIAVSDALQRRGLDAGVLTYPASPRGQARVRLFVTSEHTREQIERAASIVLETARELGFLRSR